MFYHVALAEDHAMVRQGLKSLLTTTDRYKVTIEASNGLELLDELSKASELPQFCIVDVYMPMMNGIDTIAIISSRFPSINCVAISLDNSPEIVNGLNQAGAKAFVLKENSIDDLVKAMDDILRSSLYYHHGMVSDELDVISVKLSEASEKTSTPTSVLKMLTPREREFLVHYCNGLSYKEIAAIMNVKVKTLDSFRDHICEKLGVHGRNGIMTFAKENNLIRTE